jgi:ribosome recycling factor
MTHLKKVKSASEISEDDFNRSEKEVLEELDKFNKEVEEKVKVKEEEIMKV